MSINNRYVEFPPERAPDLTGNQTQNLKGFAIWVEENIIGFIDDDSIWEYFTKIRIDGRSMTANDYIEHVMANKDHDHHEAMGISLSEYNLLRSLHT